MPSFPQLDTRSSHTSWVCKILMVIEPLLIEGHEIISNLFKAAGLAHMIAHAG